MLQWVFKVQLRHLKGLNNEYEQLLSAHAAQRFINLAGYFLYSNAGGASTVNCVLPGAKHLAAAKNKPWYAY
ncbi:MAG TPA: hypothetical protein VL307_11015 [Chitinophagaceae bacterium]|nr:hypothetical protein [Chitinophagaceae bacterium]